MTRILIADDEAHIRQALGRILRRAGHECVFASKVTEAVELFEDRPFALVLTDMRMPGDGDGLDLVATLRKLDKDVALLVCTGESDPALAEVALKRGAYGYILKPVDNNTIVIAVNNALRRRSLEIETRRQREELEHTVALQTRELRATTAALAASQEDVITRLTRAAEFRDNETASHLERMSRYCELIARRMVLPNERCEELRLASLLHDVGKIGIPDEILLKPARLTANEYALMKTHAEIGHRILKGSPHSVLQLGALIARTHHERFDGRGYPFGLCGSDIPLAGRIAAVADVFDAVTSPRVYKSASTAEEGFELLRRERGKHFDPRIVDLFLDAKDMVLRIKERYADGAPPAERTAPTELDDTQTSAAAALAARLQVAQTLPGNNGSSIDWWNVFERSLGETAHA